MLQRSWRHAEQRSNFGSFSSAARFFDGIGMLRTLERPVTELERQVGEAERNRRAERVPNRRLLAALAQH
ncbi:hypothetical protein [Mangrovicoccus sp. HB161399]|uniref:hypothetical protein n=1 Tax=Mangrovicoccus sp. HB161399 TaxID=2720392 RepID=UPI00155702C8|nr:hypothetical protein [Mangrovicoccus sp. HB161399]